MRNKVQE